jgi:GH35 family endo-1,4-beta-xylanase
MENKANRKETLRQYAETQLEIHHQELATRYYDRELASAELKAEALKAQREIFEKELAEKIAELSPEDDESSRSSLEAVKDEYVGKLQSPNPLI